MTLDMKAPTVQEQRLSSMGEAALWYGKSGWSVFPLKPGDKTPVVKWKDDATMDPEVIRAWWTRWPDANIGLACGASGLLVLDFDVEKPGFEGGELLERLRREYPTTTARTGGGGVHLLYRQPEGEELGNSRGRLPRGVDVRGHGGYIVLPPSIHPGGARYEWEVWPHERPPQPFPRFLLELLRPKPEPKSQAVVTRNGARGTAYAQAALERELGRLARAQEGERNETLNKAAFALGQLVAGGELDRPLVECELERVALAIGLEPREVEATVKSGLEAGLKEPRTAPAPTAGGKRPPARDIVFQLGLERLELFVDPAGTAFATFERDGHLETWPLRSGPVRAHLGALYRAHAGTLPGSQALQDAFLALEGEAATTVRDVFLRVAHVDGVTWLDLGGPDWRAVRVDASGWQVVDRPEVRFRRTKGSGRLPTPVPGTLADLKALLHVEAEDLPMVIGWLLGALSGMGPFPILALTGEQGTAKSTTTRLLKRLVDPAVAELRGAPRNVRDLMVAAANSWLLAFDNVSRIDSEMSDALCRIATGGGYATRALYTDAEELLLDVKRPIVLNGITDIVDRPDLQDRAIIVDLPILAEEERLPEREYWEQVEGTLPKALGFLLDALSYALGALPDTELERLPRMADFARLVEAAGPMLGLEPGQFLDLYAGNREAGTLAVLEQSPITEPLRALVRVSGKWSGTPTELLDALDGVADERAKASRRWPTSARALSAELKRLAPSLRTADVVDVRFAKSNGQRRWTVERLRRC